MKFLQPIENKKLIGRVSEKQQLDEFSRVPEAAILVVYGRRRVGKTER